MELWEEQLKKQMKELPKLDPSFLQTRLLAKLTQEQQRKTRKRKLQIWSTTVVGLSLALFVALSLPHWSRPSSSNSTASNHAAYSQLVKGGTTASRQAAFAQNQSNSLPVSDLMTSNIKLEQDSLKGITVTANLLNQSRTESMSSSNTQGLLFFYQNGKQIASYFTDAPGQPVPPRGEVTWSYQIPPDSWQPENLKNVQVVWSFVKRINWTPVSSQAAPSATRFSGSNWDIGVSPLQASPTNLTGTGANQMYMTLQADIVNPTRQTISDQDLMAFVFLPPTSGQSIMDPLTYKFMVDLNLQNDKIAPGQHQTVRFHFIGNETLNMTTRSPKIVIVAKSVPSS